MPERLTADLRSVPGFAHEVPVPLLWARDPDPQPLTMTQTDAWTIGRLLEWTTDHFRRHGAETPRLDAEVLLAEARSCQRIELYTAFDEVVDRRVRTAFRELVRRRAEGMPVAYLVGRREFYSLAFRVTPDVLIPRPETEFVVLALLDLIKEQGQVDRPLEIVDVGTGSGVLAICAARHVPNCRVTAIDISSAALQLARTNAVDHGAIDRIALVQGDLLSPVAAQQHVDFVLSNPPYVSDSEWESLTPQITGHEPRVALVAGPRGTEVISRLVPQAAERLRGGGWLITEISPMIQRDVDELIRRDGRFKSAVTDRDAAHLPRVMRAQRT